MESVRARAVGAMKSGTLLALRLGNPLYVAACSPRAEYDDSESYPGLLQMDGRMALKAKGLIERYRVRPEATPGTPLFHLRLQQGT